MNTKPAIPWGSRGACLAVILVALGTPSAARAAGGEFTFARATDRLAIAWDGRPVAEFVFRDEKILRPYFANVHTPDGRKVTRNHPPVAGQDATDHDTMHPGLWLAFGDLGGQDFWRNKARMEHRRFTEPPTAANGRLTFAAECRLLAADGTPMGSLTNRFALSRLPRAWLLVWEADFHADTGDLTFGDQEEMGFGARVATGITEKNGGVIRSSAGLKSAKSTWGQPAAWCDYSGVVRGQPLGLTVMTDPASFRPSWWHNRDYGLMLANPFGRAAMKQGAPSSVTIAHGESFRLRFGAAIHQGQPENPGACYDAFLAVLSGPP